MKLSFPAYLLAFVAAVNAAPDSKEATLAGLQVTPAFTADLALGTTLTIPLKSGGLRVIRPITSGTLKGPLLEATVLGGFAAPALYGGGAEVEPQVYIYGTAKDGSAFYVRETGVGNPASWLTKVEIEAGGIYANLSNEFIVANNAADKTKPRITVPVYKVTGQGCC